MSPGPEQPPLIRKRAIDKFDGARWYQFESPESILVLTAVGRKLLAAQRLAPLLHNYVCDYRQGTSRDTDTRRFLAAGVNSHVFSVDALPLVIKEAKPEGDQLWPSLERMDRLVNAVEKHSPDWIGIPAHYGLLLSKKDLQKQFLLMQKVNSGVTIGDILDVGKQGALPERQSLRDEAEKIFGQITPELRTEVTNRFGLLSTELRNALMQVSLSPREYLPDLDNNPYNVVIEQADPPVADSHIKYWVIDQ